MPILPVFPQSSLWSLGDQRLSLQAPEVKRVVSYALGPTGTNIEQAAKLWHVEMGVEPKAEIVLCDLPETAVKKAMEPHESGVLPVFWTCAVFKRMHTIFFGNPATLPLFHSYSMLLDEMQLASISPNVCEGNDLSGVTIASHVSPAPLVDLLVGIGARVIDASSNGEAARMCREGQVSACITTESARRIYDLETVHKFGSPVMVFFGGITADGLALLQSTKLPPVWDPTKELPARDDY